MQFYSITYVSVEMPYNILLVIKYARIKMLATNTARKLLVNSDDAY